MKAHIITLTIIDFDDLGADEASSVMENASYPNDGIHPHVQFVETFDVGAWDDAHPLNHRGTDVCAWLRRHGIVVP